MSGNIILLSCVDILPELNIVLEFFVMPNTEIGNVTSEARIYVKYKVVQI
jgi:hypothetical protein